MHKASAYAMGKMNQASVYPEFPHQSVTFSEGMGLDCGRVLPSVTVAYRTYGTLNQAKSNAIFVCHALTGDQYVAEPNPETNRPGWWATLVGPGAPVDTNKYFVICSNVLGGCMGSTGPRSAHGDDPTRPWGMEFPVITIHDMVRLQKRLVDHLGIETLFAVIGGSMGGMQVLSWAVQFPTKLFAAVPIATAHYHSAQNIAFHEIGRQAIAADPCFHQGNYAAYGERPERGLAVARMTAHITYVSEDALTRKFGRKLQNAEGLSTLGEQFAVESYLQHQGSSFVQRFDANSYLTITRAMDLFDLASAHQGSMDRAFRGTDIRFLLVSFSSDWLFPTVQSRIMARALSHAAANVSFVEVRSDKGHDAFLLEEPDFQATVRGFLQGCARLRGMR